MRKLPWTTVSVSLAQWEKNDRVSLRLQVRRFVCIRTSVTSCKQNKALLDSFNLLWNPKNRQPCPMPQREDKKKSKYQLRIARDQSGHSKHNPALTNLSVNHSSFNLLTPDTQRRSKGQRKTNYRDTSSVDKAAWAQMKLQHWVRSRPPSLWSDTKGLPRKRLWARSALIDGFIKSPITVLIAPRIWSHICTNQINHMGKYELSGGLNKSEEVGINVTRLLRNLMNSCRANRSQGWLFRIGALPCFWHLRR